MTTFADALIALGQHMNLCPGLPRVYGVCKSPYGDLVDMQLWGSSDSVADLAAWSATLTDVTSWADRMNEKSVHGRVSGLIGDVRVTVWTSIPSDVFPDGLGRHEWDVTALLQEA